MHAESRYANQLRGERPLAPFLPYMGHVSPTAISTKHGEYMRTWRVPGLAFEGQAPADLLLRKEALNTLWRSFADKSLSVYVHDVRRKTTDRLHSHFDNEFCRELDGEYYDTFKNYQMFANEIYLTIVYRPQSNQERFWNRAARRTVAELEEAQRAALVKLDEIATQIESSMHPYRGDGEGNIDALATYEKGGVLYSEYLSFLHYLASGVWQEVRVPEAPLNEYLGNAWIRAGNETIEIRAPLATRFARAVDFKEYAGKTEPGILNGLMFLENCEYVITQSFSIQSKQDGIKTLNRQISQFVSTEDAGVQQLKQMYLALDQLIDGKFVMGEYHFSMLVFGDTVEACKVNTTNAITILQNEGFIATIQGIASDAAFYSQFPGNWRYRPRLAKLTSQNFAGLACFHNFRTGKRSNNPWGDAITIAKTTSGQPAYLNFHYAKGDEDAFDKKLLGNTMIIGQAGSGKTALMNFLFTQAQKYRHAAPQGFTNFYFDKDQGSRLALSAAGSRYLTIRNGQPTGFNPFQMDATPANMEFLEQLVRGLVSTGGQRVTTADEARISHAVRTVMRMDPKLRRLSVLLQNIPESPDAEDRENSVAKRLATWCWDDGNGKRGRHWWVLDNPTDRIDLTTHHNFGFDGTQFLDNKDVRTPISMYLLHRMRQLIDGRRFIYWMDEAWKWIDDPAFSDFVGDMQLTIRKKNGLGVFATQMPESFLESAQASALIQQTATFIFLANPKASYDSYVNGFKCTPEEYGIIQSMDERSRMMLVKQGHQSFLCRLDLSPLEDKLAILSGSDDNNLLYDEITAEVGDAPQLWIPQFHERRKARVAASRRSHIKG